MRYDSIIIGTGPAGVSAAMNLKIYNKNFLWFGNRNLSEKVEKAEFIQNYPGMYGMTGKEFVVHLKEHCDSMDLKITEQLVSAIYPMGDYYAVMAENEIYETKTIIFAIGVVNSNLYPGEAEFLGRGVSYCATCDGGLYKGKNIAVLSTAKRFEHEVKYLAELANQLYFFPFYKGEQLEAENIIKKQKAFKGIYGSTKLEYVELAGEEHLEVDGVFILRNAIAATTLLAGLDFQEGHILVNRNMETNYEGVFAAGDCTGKPYQYAKAVGEGNIAAHAVIEFLDK